MRSNLRMIGKIGTLISVIVCGGLAASQKEEHLSITSHRALAMALGALEDRYGWLITYEDPSYTFSEDLVDRTRSNSRHPDESYKEGHVDLVPVERTIEFDYQVDALTESPSEPEKVVVERAVASFKNASGYEFGIKQIGNRLHVFPKLSKNAEGQAAPIKPLMDAEISFPKTPRNAMETLKTICDAIGATTHASVKRGSFSINLFIQTNTSLGALNQPAREVLASFLDSLDPRFSWKLLYDAGEQEYYLSVHRVKSQSEKVEEVNSAGAASSIVPNTTEPGATTVSGKPPGLK